MSGHLEIAKLAATSCDAVVDMQANSVPPCAMNSIVRPRSFLGAPGHGKKCYLESNLNRATFWLHAVNHIEP